ncbi:PD-(D/E)XK nuclease family transposase [Oceanobacillus oncorhynchi]|uniref:PD-(D/E)XK nuclease family transposase n=1 Tax=Oceanobacillus oncorhynchi TaxID=545501 RepID=UPI0018674D2B
MSPKSILLIINTLSACTGRIQVIQQISKKKKVDYAFKQLFGNEKNKDITVVFLNAILAKSGRSPIQQLYFQNIEIGIKNRKVMKILSGRSNSQ